MKKSVKLLIVLFATLWVTKEILLPAGTALLYSEKYMETAMECDTAMEADWYYRQNNPKLGKSLTTQLLVCHEYDKTRKILLTSGLPQSYLSWLGLKSLELNQRSPEEFVRQHRFKKR